MDTSKIDDMVNSIANGSNANSKPEPKMTKCPCCGKMTLPSPPKIGSEIMDGFMACMITGSPYQYTYELYGGRLKITAEQITDASRKIVLDSSVVLDNLLKLVPTMGAEVMDIKNKITTFACIPTIEINTGTKATFHPAEVTDNVFKELDAVKFSAVDGTLKTEDARNLISKLVAQLQNKSLMSAVPEEMAAAVFQMHAELYRMLMDCGFDENFWSRIKLE